MDYYLNKLNLNKLKKDIKSTISNVLPGNPVTREYEITSQACSAGSALLWKIYDAYKKSTREESSVFVFEKKLIDNLSKPDQEFVIESLKKGISQLTRLRHPRILTIQHPLEESRESLAFATEPVLLSLANALGKHENMPKPLPTHLKDFKLYPVEIKYGLLQLTEALMFLHADVKLLHRNICPESVLIGKNGSWKLAGLDFCESSTVPPDKPPNFSTYSWSENITPTAQPNLNYFAPEYVLNKSCETASDMYSLGVLAYSVFNNGKVIFDNCCSLSTFRGNASQLDRLPNSTLACLPDAIQQHVKMLLNANPAVRPDAHQLSKIEFFQGGDVKALEYLDSLFQVDNLQKSQFFKGLPKILHQFPKRVCLHRIFHCLAKELVNADMIPFVLPSILVIANQATDEEYNAMIFPQLKPSFTLPEPVQIMLIYLQNMELLLKKTPHEQVKNHVLPMVYRALESQQPQIQELCLSIIPTFAGLVDYPSIKNSILPRLRKICLTTSSVAICVNTLLCIGKLLEHLDKWLVIDDVLPMLSNIKSREPAVLMAMLGIYKMAMTHKKLGITKEVMATKVLPFLLPICIDSNLNLSQFNSYMSVVHEMVGKVEVEHRTKLEQLDSIRTEQSSALQYSLNASDDSLVPGIKTKSTQMENIFAGLGLNSYMESKSVDDVNKTIATPSKADAVRNALTPSKGSLTMQEKESLARQQAEASAKQQGQVPTMKLQQLQQRQPTKPQSQDLTSSLINTNLSAMNTNTNTSWQKNVPPPSTAFDNLFPRMPQTSSPMNSMQQQPAPSPMYRPTMQGPPPTMGPMQQSINMHSMQPTMSNNMNNSMRPMMSNMPTMPPAGFQAARTQNKNVSLQQNSTIGKDLDDLFG